MTPEYWIISCAVVVGAYTAMNIGANDLANAMGTSVGAGSLSLKKAVIVAGTANFLGAVLAGGSVTNTVRKGIIDPTVFTDSPYSLAFGMFCALLSAAIWLQFATTLGLPVSTSHSIVGAIVGFGLISGGITCVSWSTIVQIVLSWIVSPLGGAVLAAVTFVFIDKFILDNTNPERAIIRYSPYLVFVVALILVLSFIFKGLKHLKLGLGTSSIFFIACGFGAIASFISWLIIRKISVTLKTRRKLKEKFGVVEGTFGALQVLTAGYVAFAHGANDVANAVGPLAAFFSVVDSGEVAMKVNVDWWMLALGGAGIAAGLAIWGSKVIKTVGEKITDMTPSRGFAAEFGAATTIMVCSKLGMPISTTHTLVGGVIGVGTMRGMSALNLKILSRIFASWIITLPVAAVLTVITYKLGAPYLIPLLGQLG